MSTNFIELPNLKEFKEVKDVQDLNDFKRLAQMEDCIIKELHLVNSAYVDQEKSMDLNFEYQVRMLIHSMSFPYALELLLGEVLGLELGSPTSGVGISNIEMTWETTTSHKRILLELENNKIIARRLMYRGAPNWIGNYSRFGEEIILDPLLPVTPLENGWVLCTNCQVVWDAKNRQIQKCPNCGGRRA